MYTNWPVLAEFYALRVHIVFTYFYLLTEFGDSVLIVFFLIVRRDRETVTRRRQILKFQQRTRVCERVSPNTAERAYLGA